MFEYEKKIILSADEYERLLLMMGKNLPVTQTNYYYDSDDFKMNQDGVTCRIREKNDRYKATIKTHLLVARDCSVEKSKDVSEKDDTSLFDGMDIKLQGYLITERTTIYSYPGVIEAVIDKNTYLDVIDHELEIEYTIGYEDLALKLLTDIAHILYSGKDMIDFCDRTKFSESKSQRFTRRKKLLKMKGDIIHDVYSSRN